MRRNDRQNGQEVIDVLREAAAALTTPPQPRDGVTEEIRRGICAAKLLLENCIGCTEKHFGRKPDDPLPPWLADCKRDIDNLQRTLSQPPQCDECGAVHDPKDACSENEWSDA